ncbi:hypothetical protein HMPREF9554_00943 [Treponema phagedenis F0421]|nr:hypothetical protein HMPREF9554_00943 [Treponema phagedenis F0421]
MVPYRIEFENYHICIIGVFKLIGLVLPRTAKPNRCVELFFNKIFYDLISDELKTLFEDIKKRYAKL